MKKGPQGLALAWHSAFEEETFCRACRRLTTPRFRRIGKHMWSKRVRRTEKRDVGEGMDEHPN